MGEALNPEVTTTQPSSVVVATADGAQDPPPDQVGLVRIGVSLFVVQTAIYTALVASTSILLPVMILTAVGDGSKEGWLGIITSIGAIAAMIASPAIGLWSDRTRSRLGRRAPWILGGGVIFALGLIWTGLWAHAISLLLAWCVVQVGCAAMQIVVGTVLPERVPLKKRGLLTGLIALGTTSAVLGAAFLGAAFVGNPLLGMVVLSSILIVGALGFILLAPQGSSTELAPTPARQVEGSKIKDFFAAFGENNFKWVWVGRFFITLAYQLILTRMLYFMQNWFHMDVAIAASSVATVTAATGLLTLIGLVVSSPLSDRFGRKPFVLASGGLVATGLVLVIFTSSIPMFIAAYGVVALGMGVFSGVDAALAADVLPAKDDFGKDLGFINLASTLPATLAPAIGSLILLVSGGSYVGMLVFGAAAALTCVFATTRIKGVR